MDKALRDIIDTDYDRARTILEDNKDLLEKAAEELSEEETFESDKLEDLKEKLTVPDKVKKAA